MMKNPFIHKVFLIGFMGSGKTTLGKSMAGKLGIPFLDLDHIIEKEEGKSIAQIFEEIGENEFRKLEGRYLKNFLYPEQFILSAGGGTPCFHDHLEWMNQKGITVYIQLSAHSLAARLLAAKDPVRPLVKNIQPENLEAFIEERLKEREIYYTRAQKIVKGENLSPDRLIQIIS